MKYCVIFVCHLKQSSGLIPAVQVNIFMAELTRSLLYTDKVVIKAGVLSRLRGPMLETKCSLTLPAWVDESKLENFTLRRNNLFQTNSYKQTTHLNHPGASLAICITTSGPKERQLMVVPVVN